MYNYIANQDMFELSATQFYNFLIIKKYKAMKKSMYTIHEMELTYLPKYSAEEDKINSSKSAYELLMKIYNPNTILCQEESIVIYMNRGNKISGVQKLSKGGVTGTIIDTRLILSTALKSLSTGIIISHNHPSGNKNPSENDLMITSKLRHACDLLDIKLLDHIIVTKDNGFYSFTDNLQL